MNQSRNAGAAYAIAIVLLAGCGGDTPTQSQGPRPSASPTESASPPPCAGTWILASGTLTVIVTTPGPAVVDVLALHAGAGASSPSTFGTVPAGGTGIVFHLAAAAAPAEVDVTVKANQTISACQATPA